MKRDSNQRMAVIHKRIRLFGVVQGVGFRPFVHRLAVSLNIAGTVCNKGSYVEIEAEAPEEQEACGEPDEPVSVPGSDDSPEIPYIEVPESDKPEKVDEPLSSAINSLFEQMPPVDQLADKVNASLDEMGEQLKKFSDHFGKQLNDMADELLGNSDHKDE